jgi:hypothetical protein
MARLENQHQLPPKTPRASSSNLEGPEVWAFKRDRNGVCKEKARVVKRKKLDGNKKQQVMAKNRKNGGRQGAKMPVDRAPMDC